MMGGGGATLATGGASALLPEVTPPRKRRGGLPRKWRALPRKRRGAGRAAMAAEEPQQPQPEPLGGSDADGTD